MDRALWRLNRYRIRRNLSWNQLAAEMKAEGLSVSAAALYNIVMKPQPRGPFNRTVHKIRTFVELQTARATARPRRPYRRKH
jgi:hypothetical protein